MSSDWTQGYAADIEYAPGFYGNLAPDHLDLVCLLNGVAPPARGDGFTYCELGSGQGLTSLALAAANPEGAFHAVDFNPAHTARAQETARAAGLSNLTCLEESFEVLADGGPELPAFDYVTMHGVWSWVSPELRAAILRFLARRLKPGGVVQVSYNAMPGWSAGLPVQFLLHALAGEARGASDARLLQALSVVTRMAEAESPYLTENDVITRVRETADRGELPYLVHEYMTPHWAPQFHATVARDMAQAKLAYVGSTVLPCNFPDLMLKESQRAIWNEIEDPALRETVVDFFNLRSFRSDVFVRGRRALEPSRRDARLGAVRLGPALPREAVQLGVAVPAGTVNISEDIYGPILERLEQGPAPIAELVACAGTPPGTQLNPVEVAGLLGSINASMPMREGPRMPAPVPLNMVLGAEALSQSGNHPSVAVLPAFGTGMSCPSLEVAVLSLVCEAGSADAHTIAETVWNHILARGEALMRDGRRIEDPAENVRILADQVSEILNSRLAIWRMHGALPPGMA